MSNLAKTISFLAFFVGVSAVAAEPRPNVILIVTDDQGAADAGCYGAKDLLTPAIDSLAARGVRFTQFYAGAPVCSPSRAALLTGRYPPRAGLMGNASSQPGGSGMPTEQITLAEMFHAAGYATAHIGKWHLGFRPDQMPNAARVRLLFRPHGRLHRQLLAFLLLARAQSTRSFSQWQRGFLSGQILPRSDGGGSGTLPGNESRSALLPVLCPQHAPLSLPGRREVAEALPRTALSAQPLCGVSLHL